MCLIKQENTLIQSNTPDNTQSSNCKILYDGELGVSLKDKQNGHLGKMYNFNKKVQKQSCIFQTQQFFRGSNTDQIIINIKQIHNVSIQILFTYQKQNVFIFNSNQKKENLEFTQNIYESLNNQNIQQIPSFIYKGTKNYGQFIILLQALTTDDYKFTYELATNKCQNFCGDKLCSRVGNNYFPYLEDIEQKNQDEFLCKCFEEFYDTCEPTEFYKTTHKNCQINEEDNIGELFNDRSLDYEISCIFKTPDLSHNIYSHYQFEITEFKDVSVEIYFVNHDQKKQIFKYSQNFLNMTLSYELYTEEILSENSHYLIILQEENRLTSKFQFIFKPRGYLIPFIDIKLFTLAFLIIITILFISFITQFIYIKCFPYKSDQSQIIEDNDENENSLDKKINNFTEDLQETEDNLQKKQAFIFGKAAYTNQNINSLKKSNIKSNLNPQNSQKNILNYTNTETESVQQDQQQIEKISKEEQIRNQIQHDIQKHLIFVKIRQMPSFFQFFYALKMILITSLVLFNVSLNFLYFATNQFKNNYFKFGALASNILYPILSITLLGIFHKKFLKFIENYQIQVFRERVQENLLIKKLKFKQRIGVILLYYFGLAPYFKYFSINFDRNTRDNLGIKSPILKYMQLIEVFTVNIPQIYLQGFNNELLNQDYTLFTYLSFSINFIMLFINSREFFSYFAIKKQRSTLYREIFYQPAFIQFFKKYLKYIEKETYALQAYKYLQYTIWVNKVKEQKQLNDENSQNSSNDNLQDQKFTEDEKQDMLYEIELLEKDLQNLDEVGQLRNVQLRVRELKLKME